MQTSKNITTLLFTKNYKELLVEGQVLYKLCYCCYLFIYFVCKMDITKFLRDSKKRDLSHQSGSGEQQNQGRE